MAHLSRVAVARWETVKGEQIEAYWRCLREANLDPIDYCKPGLSLADCAGLVLTGGVDIDPARYGDEADLQTQTPNRERDEFELDLLNEALAKDMPVLAICRGHQLLNVCLGGKLLQHIESGDHASRPDPGRTSSAHDVVLTAGSRLRDWIGRERPQVNSRHHQAVTPAVLASGLCATALSPDGLIEAVESERHAWVVGVQWHPERDEPQIEGFAAASQRLFQAFARAAGV